MRRLFVLAALLVATRAGAENWPSWAQDGKAGRFMFNLKLGPAIGVSRAAFHSAALELDFGVALNADRSAYLVLSPGVQAGAVGTIVFVPVGFQYDFKLPVPGLYLSPRVLLGYAALLPGSGPSYSTGYVAFELGVKYVFKQRWNVGLEPFSLPIIFGSAGGQSFTEIYYRLLVYGGLNF